MESSEAEFMEAAVDRLIPSLEPFYDKFERVAGTSGKAGNLKGKIQPGGNPFEGERSQEYAKSWFL